ncbi:MAG: hypothetical protein KIT44_15345, partial [Opitutaceae bacterium]|nr:hypothetical protein [Opitutaceae bacterium]
MYREDSYFGTRDGVWLENDQYEARIWGQPRQAVTGLAVRLDRMVIAAGNQLFTGPVDESSQWRELGREAFVPEPANDWQHLRVLSHWFVARSSKGFYTSGNGARWEKIAPENKQILGVAAGVLGLWVVASEPGKPGYVLGRSEDLRTWTWSEPLPEHFKPGSPVFPVVGEGVAVLAGTYASRGEMFNVPQALLSFHWPHEGPARWQLAVHAMPPGGSLIEVAQMGEDAWARLPNGDLAASVTGFDWIRVAAQPLGTANTWFLSDNPANDYLLLAANDGRYLWFSQHALEYAGRGGAAEIAWQEVKGSASAPDSAASAAPAGLVPGALPAQTKKVVFAGGKYLAITWAKNGLWAAEPGGPWRNVAAFGKQVNDIAVLGDRALAVVDYTGTLLWDAANGRTLPVEPPPTNGFSTVHAVNGRFFGISSGGHLVELGADGRWQRITLPSDDPNFGVQSLAYHDGHFLVSPVRQAGLYRTTDFQTWSYAPMKGGNSRFGRLFNTGRRLLAVHHYGELEKDDSPVVLSVSTDGVAWQEIEGIV